MSGSIITVFNEFGDLFCENALAMLVQSSILILVLLVIDLLLRKRTRAVFRYCIWLLVFVKLAIPPTFSLPTGIGYWRGDYVRTDSITVETISYACGRPCQDTYDHAFCGIFRIAAGTTCRVCRDSCRGGIGCGTSIALHQLAGSHFARVVLGRIGAGGGADEAGMVCPEPHCPERTCGRQTHRYTE